MTVLFADLAGSTAFEEIVDAETATRGDRPLPRAAALHRRAAPGQGDQELRIGDGSMAVWGVPEIPGPTTPAGRSTLVPNSRSALSGWPGTWLRRTKWSWPCGVAVTGEVVVGAEDAGSGRRRAGCRGAWNRECPHGQVVVGEETWRRRRVAACYEPLGAVQVKAGRPRANRSMLRLGGRRVDHLGQPG